MMGPVWLRARRELRRRWQGNLFVAVLVGLVGGVLLFGVSGARRTSSALDRFLAYSRPFDAFLYGEALDVAAVERLPQVVDVDGAYYFLMAPVTPDGRPDPALGINPSAATMGRTGTSSERYLLVAGRPAHPDDPLEVMVNEELARARGVRPGGTIRMWAYTHEQLGAILEGLGTEMPEGRLFDFRVTGIVRLPQHVGARPRDRDVVFLAAQDLYLTAAFARRHAAEVANFNQLNVKALNVRLARGALDLPAFREAVRALPGGETVEFDVASEGPRWVADAKRAVHVETLALLLFACAVAATGLLVAGQSVARQVELQAQDYGTLRALGMTQGQIVASTATQAAFLALVGVVVAVALALALSPFSPVGLARRAEVDAGMAIDVPVLALGGLLLVIVMVGRASVSATRLARLTAAPQLRERPALRRPRLAERLARAGVPVTAVTGLRMALEPGAGRGAVPLRPAVAGTAVAVAAAVGGLTFAASLDRLLDSPRHYGWNWDLTVGNFNTEDMENGRRMLAANPAVAGFTAVSHGQRLQVHGQEVWFSGLWLLTGAVGPEVLAGRLPARAGEISLGPRTLDRLGLEVGDQVDVQSEDDGSSSTLTVVGSALVGHPVLNGFNGQRLGEGGVATLEGLAGLVGGSEPAIFLVNLVEGVDLEEAFAGLQADWGKTVLRPIPPDRVENLRRVAALPVAFAAILALLGVATLGHMLVTAVRRRRHDLAVLKAIGFVRTQASVTVAWHATTVAVLSLVVGLPVGTSAGRWAWRAVADGVGTPAGAVIPFIAVAVAVPFTVLVANLVAGLPALAAARVRPAVILRAE